MQKKTATLGGVQQKFVLHWGEMGTPRGINRMVAQIHALRYIASEPFHAETVVNIRGVARSNVSTSIKELRGWLRARCIPRVLESRRQRGLLPQMPRWSS